MDARISGVCLYIGRSMIEYQTRCMLVLGSKRGRSVGTCKDERALVLLLYLGRLSWEKSKWRK